MRRMHDEKEIANKLYQHVVYIADSNEDLQVYFVIISPKSVVIDSLADLKTYLGNTFSYQVSGFDFQGGLPIYLMNESVLLTSGGSQLWSIFTTWNDQVTPL